jgi:DNA-binding Lrp family transcriptional regulator
VRKSLIKIIQGDLELKKNQFSKNDLEQIRAAVQKKVIRRFCAILNHRRIGFRANCMVTWNVPAQRIVRTGKQFARINQISHCYQRPAFKDFNYSLYTMVHGRSADAINKLVRQLGHKMKIKDYQMLWSIEELKKTSPIFA